MTPWVKDIDASDARVLVDNDGKPIMCDTCPLVDIDQVNDFTVSGLPLDLADGTWRATDESWEKGGGYGEWVMADEVDNDDYYLNLWIKFIGGSRYLINAAVGIKPIDYDDPSTWFVGYWTKVSVCFRAYETDITGDYYHSDINGNPITVNPYPNISVSVDVIGPVP